MASIKMQQFETEFLKHTSQLKEMVLKTVTEENFGDEANDLKQEFLIKINDMFNCGHSKVRKMNKTVAFLHRELDELKGKQPTLGTLGDRVNESDDK